MNLTDEIPVDFIDRAEHSDACRKAVRWLKAVPRTWGELMMKNPVWLLFGCRIGICYPSKWVDECAERSPWAALEFASDFLTPERKKWCEEKLNASK